VGFQSNVHTTGKRQNLKSRRTCGWLLFLVILISFWTAPEAQAPEVSPTSLSFTGVQGGSTPPSQTVTVSKNNDRTLNWASMDNATRLTSTPT